MANPLRKMRFRSIHLFRTVFPIMIASLLLTACWGGKRYHYEGDVMTLEEFRSPPELSEPQDIANNGKIILYKQYLIVNDPGLGIHIFDNSVPESPTPLGFIKIPANHDVAVKNDLLYAHSATDLVVLDISDMSDIQVKHRMENAFRPIYPADLLGYDSSEYVVIELRKIERG